jgi:DNA-directed RNA polymerase specialized sigma24 family protein
MFKMNAVGRSFSTDIGASFTTSRAAPGLADAEAQDVVQNTFIYLSRKIPGSIYDPGRGSFKSWLGW